MPNTICVIGEGAFGTAIATLIANNGYKVNLWCHNPKNAESINLKQINQEFFPDKILNKNIYATTNLQEALHEADFIFEAIPVKFLRSVFVQAQPFVNKNQVWVILSKGIEQHSLLFPSQVLDDVFKFNVEKVVLAGPSFAKEIIEKKLTTVNLACSNLEIGYNVQRILDNQYFKTYAISDVIGAQICSALKNVISLAIGIADGANYGDNSKGFLLTLGLNEIKKIILHFNGSVDTINDLCGIGDLVISAFGDLGRNFKVGQMLGTGKNLQAILQETNLIPESANTLQSINELIKKEKLDLPFCEGIYKIVFEAKKVEDFFKEILKSKFDI